MKCLRFFLSAVSAILIAAPAANAATVAVVHGIDGRDLGLPKELPVDIAVNGKCSLVGVRFTQSTEVTLPAGKYSVTVHPSDGKCTQASVVEKTIEIGAADALYRFSVVASLTPRGLPQLAVFNDSISRGLGAGVTIRHLAVAAPVSVRYAVNGYPHIPAQTIANGKETIFSVLGARRLPYSARISAGKTPLATIRGTARNGLQIVNIVGSTKSGLTVIRQDFRF